MVLLLFESLQSLSDEAVVEICTAVGFCGGAGLILGSNVVVVVVLVVVVTMGATMVAPLGALAGVIATYFGTVIKTVGAAMITSKLFPLCSGSISFSNSL